MPKPQVEIWRKPKKMKSQTPISYSTPNIVCSLSGLLLTLHTVRGRCITGEPLNVEWLSIKPAKTSRGVMFCKMIAKRSRLLILLSLELRRLHLDLIYCYKIVFGLACVNFDDLFKFSTITHTRGHCYKLYKSRCTIAQSERTFLLRGLLMCGTICLRVSISRH